MARAASEEHLLDEGNVFLRLGADGPDDQVGGSYDSDKSDSGDVVASLSPSHFWSVDSARPKITAAPQTRAGARDATAAVRGDKGGSQRPRATTIAADGTEGSDRGCDCAPCRGKRPLGSQESAEPAMVKEPSAVISSESSAVTSDSSSMESIEVVARKRLRRDRLGRKSLRSEGAVAEFEELVSQALKGQGDAVAGAAARPPSPGGRSGALVAPRGEGSLDELDRLIALFWLSRDLPPLVASPAARHERKLQEAIGDLIAEPWTPYLYGPQLAQDWTPAASLGKVELQFRLKQRTGSKAALVFAVREPAATGKVWTPLSQELVPTLVDGRLSLDGELLFAGFGLPNIPDVLDVNMALPTQLYELAMLGAGQQRRSALELARSPWADRITSSDKPPRVLVKFCFEAKQSKRRVLWRTHSTLR